LCIRSFEQLDSQDVDFFIGSLPVERQIKGGACQLREVDIHVDASAAAAAAVAAKTQTCVVVHPPSPRFVVESPNMKVNIVINDSSSSDEDDGEDSDDWDGDGDGDDDYNSSCYYEDGRQDYMMGLDPYEPGGAFNDPFFDAYYSSRFQPEIASVR
jgi:hypothetical protein